MNPLHLVDNVARLMGGVDPWAVLRAHPEWRLHFAHLPPGVRGFTVLHPDGSADIYLSCSLNRVDRNATLRHEENHILFKRLISGDARWDERGVRELTAADLIPEDELAAMFDVAVTNDLPVEVWMVADKFDVPMHVAELRMTEFLKARYAA